MGTSASDYGSANDLLDGGNVTAGLLAVRAEVIIYGVGDFFSWGDGDVQY